MITGNSSPGEKRSKEESKNAPLQSSQLMKLFEDGLKDICWAERALTKAIPKMVKNATSRELIDALKSHLAETEKQVTRLEQVPELKLPPVSKAKSKEMDIANKFVEQLTEEFSIEKYKDTYTAKLLKIIKKKSKGKKITKPKMKVVPKESDDLMDMLKASLPGKISKTA